MQLSKDQRSALDRIHEWIARPYGQQFFTLTGLAGTGKTTILRHFIDELDFTKTACVLAPTNKAAAVLRSKGLRHAATIHSKLYQPVPSKDREHADQIEFEFIGHRLASDPVLVIDEASMVNEDMLDDLYLSDCLVLFVGDAGQLPPIGRDPGLLNKPEVELQRIHRQAAGNSIIDFAHHVREGNDPFTWAPGEGLDVTVCPPGHSLLRLPQVDVWLCGTNNLRIKLNKALLAAAGGQPRFVQVQLRESMLSNGIFNGEVHTVAVESWSALGHPEVVRFSSGVKVSCHPSQWHQERPLPYNPKSTVKVDYGYAITTHSAQGSEWPSVAVVDQPPREEAERWRYTAATRASSRLYWMAPDALTLEVKR